jgi:hypothetical protein
MGIAQNGFDTSLILFSFFAFCPQSKTVLIIAVYREKSSEKSG